MICQEGAWASNRFGRLRCLRSTALKGTRQDDSGEQRMRNYFYFVGAGAEADPEGERGWAHASPMGYRSGHIPGAPAGNPFWP